MKKLTKLAIAIAAVAVGNPCSSMAQNGIWNVDADGLWSDTANWSGGTIATGAGNTADFGTPPITAEPTVTLDISRTIGTLNIGETALSYVYQNFKSTNGSVFTMSNGGSTPNLISSGYRQLST